MQSTYHKHRGRPFLLFFEYQQDIMLTLLLFLFGAANHPGFSRTRENGKRPWIWNFVPGREKALNFVLESWKITCGKLILRVFSHKLSPCHWNTSVSLLPIFAKFTNFPSFHRKFWTQRVPVSYHSKQRRELTDGHPSLFRTCAQSWNAAATKFDRHGNFEARQVL